MDRLRLIVFSRTTSLVATLRMGAFAREGLAIEVTRATSSASQIRGLLAGEYDIAHTSPDNVMAYVDREAADLVVLLVLQLGVGQRLVARPDVLAIGELQGRPVGVDALESGYAFVLYQMLAGAGLRRGDYRVESIGGTAERFAALVAGRIDAALLSGPFDDQAAASGCRILAAASSAFPGFPGTSVASRRSWANAHRDLAVRYCRALLAGARWTASPGNRDAAIDFVAADQACDRETADALFERDSRDVERVAPSVTEAREALTRVAALRRNSTGSAEAPNIDRYFDPSYTLAADPSLAG